MMLLPQDLSFSKTLNPSLSLLQFPSLKPSQTQTKTPTPKSLKSPLSLNSLQIPPISCHSPPPSLQNPSLSRLRCWAGRSKKKADGQSPGRVEGAAEIHRRVKRNARIKAKKLAESFFYRLNNINNPNNKYADNFTEEELEQIGLGYDRMVRFMDKDDPRLRHPYDWYKYGEFGPYSWRGVVLGEPIRGQFSDERVTLISEVKNHEEWDEIEQHEMNIDFSERLKEMDKDVGFRYFWVFIRHPKWRLSDYPWQQWTLVSEVVLEAGKQRLDKWSLMGRLGNKSRQAITKCAAWMRPDIVYVKRPVYQCRFEPQDDFFKVLTPFLDPKTEGDYLFETRNDDGSVEVCTYYGGLCKIVKVSQKAFVDDVVKGYEKLSDERKSDCLKFLLGNHPVNLLHPYTKEWKAKLEEMELGCDAPDEDEEDERNGDAGEKVITDWIEDDEGEDGEDVVINMEGGGDGEEDDLEIEEEDSGDEEGDGKYWEEEFEKAVSSADSMEKLAKQSVERTTEFYKKQFRKVEKNDKGRIEDDGDETALRGKRAKVSPEEWKIAGIGPWRKRIKKSILPPDLFLRAAVRPFTYRNLVKEIVLTRHAIVDGEIGQ
ncbi:hypothetical protein CFOL_v3_28661 [Cephalotus follicularis]|uniref:Uncharacterized protein n=1 Tax=Cephalotus follicularis TaxID=3775 RepID=A0A1Q3CYU3_CEPFO|nr:hypothetical protein CFOL_v3_28661 [Cephalotus follicularis]